MDDGARAELTALIARRAAVAAVGPPSDYERWWDPVLSPWVPDLARTLLSFGAEMGLFDELRATRVVDAHRRQLVHLPPPPAPPKKKRPVRASSATSPSFAERTMKTSPILLALALSLAACGGSPAVVATTLPRLAAGAADAAPIPARYLT